MNPTSGRGVLRSAIFAIHQDAIATLRDLLTDPPARLTLLHPSAYSCEGSRSKLTHDSCKDSGQLEGGSERSCHRNAPVRLPFVGFWVPFGALIRRVGYARPALLYWTGAPFTTH